jgi:hypothetical protein
MEETKETESTDFTKIKEEHKHLMDHDEDFELILQIFEKCILNSDLPALEVGNNMGGSSKCFLDVISKNKKNNYFIGVDPYGSIAYHHGAGIIESFYTNKRYHAAMAELYTFAKEKELNYTHFKVTSEDFACIIYPHVKIYNEKTANKLDKFSFVFLDGSHDPEVVAKEMMFFQDKIVSGGTIIVEEWVEERFGNFMEDFFKASGPSLVRGTGIKQRLVLDKK